MMQEARDFKDESDTLAAVLADADDTLFATVTQFKNWTIEDVIGHLHIWNVAALMTLQDPGAFQQFIRDIMAGFQTGKAILMCNMNGWTNMQAVHAARRCSTPIALIIRSLPQPMARPIPNSASPGPDRT